MIGKILCWLNCHRMVHVDCWHVGNGGIREECYRECSRCKARLDWFGNEIEEKRNVRKR